MKYADIGQDIVYAAAPPRRRGELGMFSADRVRIIDRRKVWGMGRSATDLAFRISENAGTSMLGVMLAPDGTDGRQVLLDPARIVGTWADHVAQQDRNRALQAQRNAKEAENRAWLEGITTRLQERGVPVRALTQGLLLAWQDGEALLTLLDTVRQEGYDAGHDRHSDDT